MLKQLERFDAYLRSLRPASRAFWTACAVPAGVLVLYLGLLDLPRLWRLCQGGIRVDATVVGTPCAGGTRRFSYRFDADARTLTGVGRVSELGLDCSTLAAGVVVPVYYLSADPTVSDVTADPRRSLRHRAIIVAGFGLAALLSAAGVFVAFNASRRSRNA